MTPVDTEDMTCASTFELFLEFGNDHLAKTFDRIVEQLNKRRASKETLLNEINTRTKANIILSILGLGLIYRQQGYSELSDMPDIINFVEAELRELNMDDYMHKIRGQHPEARNNQIADTEIMTERERAPIIDLDTNLQDQEMIED
eukprot:14155756-Heterocapsa_arctica.AAC.1